MSKTVNRNLSASPCEDIPLLDVVPAIPCEDTTDLNLPAFSSANNTVRDIVPEISRADIADLSQVASSSTDMMALDLPASSSSNVNKCTLLPNKKIKEARKKNVKRIPLNWKKEHVDFMSDEECFMFFSDSEDCSTESSELWSEKESDLSSLDCKDETEPRKGKKRKKSLKKKKNTRHKKRIYNLRKQKQ